MTVESDSRPRPTEGLGRFVALLGVSGVGSAALAAASVVRTRLVAAGLGPAGLALAGQMSSAVNALALISTLGSSGSARFLAEALDRRDLAHAATVIRTTVLLLAAVAALVTGVGALALSPLAVLIFGDAAAAPWVAWLLAAVPLAAFTAAATAVLRGAQQLGRLSAARMVAAVLSVAGCAALVHPRDPALVVLVPLVLVAAMAAATTAAAWPVCRPWLSSGGRWFTGHIARAIASYGMANLVVGLSSAASLIAVGRHYLAAGDLDTAGRIAALIWLGEPLAAALAAGHQASTYPAYAAARGPAADAVLARGLHGLVIVAAPTLGALALAAGPLVVLVFSPAFADITGLVAMQLLATYARSATFVLGIPLMARGRLALVTTLHLMWAVGLAAGAIGWAAPGVAGASAFVIACLLANTGYLLLQGLALRASGMGPSRSDVTWVAAGAVPLALVAVF